ncbi:uncharacterized protein LOC113585166 [Electrophorus electricus]|uniref:uncharacterized protein LOC113585166 n=1 Tax=Electrophorus electricus TaxID=8005 RepID=UPI0015CFF49F|nr:uncharacterized protein LOC113585166 [Electrophorus electricus]
MGCSNSRKVDDAQPLIPLINHKGQYIEDPPLFNELNLVIIGSHCSGKNTVANVILRHNAFSFWTRFSKYRVKKSGEVFGRRIQLIRVPGWTGDLSVSVHNQKRTKQQLVTSVQSNFETGPHAVLLALDVNSTITDTTRKTLESLLTEEIWDHTVVIFTHGEKLYDITIKDQIHVNQLSELIERCGKRYHVLHNSMPTKQSAELIETLEYFIADKDAPVKFSLFDQVMGNGDLEEQQSLIERLRNKIKSLKEFKTSLSVKGSHHSSQSLIESKNAEIRRLQNILKKREHDLQRLKTQLQQTQNGNLLNSVVSSRCTDCEKKDEELCRLHEELSKLKTIVEAHNQSSGQGQPSELNTMAWSHKTQRLPTNLFERPPSCAHELHSDNLREWPLTLSNVLGDLNDSQFKRMKSLMHFREDWRIPESLLDDKDRDSLALLLIQTWGEKQCIINIKNIIKEIPRNDNSMKKLIMPYLEEIGEIW